MSAYVAVVFRYLLQFFPALLALVGVIAAEAMLSRPRLRWWPGLIPPGVLAVAALVFAAVRLAAGDAPGRALAVFFLAGLPAWILLLVYAICRIRRAWVTAALIACIVGILPLPVMAKDGGSRAYTAVLYRVVLMHRFAPDFEQSGRYIEDVRVEVFPFHWFSDPFGKYDA